MGYCRRRNGKRLVWQIKAPSMIFTAFYRGFHHGALSFSRSIRFTSGALPFRALSWFSPRCILFYRGLYHGALSSRVPSGSHLVHSVLSWSPSRCTLFYQIHIWCTLLFAFYRGLNHGLLYFPFIVVFITVHVPFALYQVHTWCTPLYRGLHHGALSFRVLSGLDLVHSVLSWSPSRCTFLSALYLGFQLRGACLLFYHGASIMVHLIVNSDQSHIQPQLLDLVHFMTFHACGRNAVNATAGIM